MFIGVCTNISRVIEIPTTVKRENNMILNVSQSKSPIRINLFIEVTMSHRDNFINVDHCDDALKNP